MWIKNQVVCLERKLLNMFYFLREYHDLSSGDSFKEGFKLDECGKINDSGNSLPLCCSYSLAKLTGII